MGAKNIFYRLNFNKTGQIIDSCVFSSDGSLTLQYSFLYDTKGRKNQLHTFYPLDEFESKTVYRYDKHENKIEEAAYSSDDSLLWKKSYRYDHKANLIEMRESCNLVVIISRFENGNLIEMCEYDRKGQLTNKRIFKYDQQSNPIKMY